MCVVYTRHMHACPLMCYVRRIAVGRNAQGRPMLRKMCARRMRAPGLQSRWRHSVTQQPPDSAWLACRLRMAGARRSQSGSGPQLQGWRVVAGGLGAGRCAPARGQGAAAAAPAVAWTRVRRPRPQAEHRARPARRLARNRASPARRGGPAAERPRPRPRGPARGPRPRGSRLVARGGAQGFAPSAALHSCSFLKCAPASDRR